MKKTISIVLGMNHNFCNETSMHLQLTYFYRISFADFVYKTTFPSDSPYSEFTFTESESLPNTFHIPVNGIKATNPSNNPPQK